MHDSHTHLTIDPISNNILSALESFKHKGGKWLLNTSHDIESLNTVFQISKEYENKFPGIILTALGLHPEIYNTAEESIFKKVNKNTERFEKKLKENIKNVSAIGETGLDYYHIFNNSAISPEDREIIIEAQKMSLRKHLELALELNLPLTLHTRDIHGTSSSTEDMLRLIAEVGNGRLRGSFHSYTGDIKHINEILDLGFHIGFNGIITYPSGGSVREILRNTPIDRILFETDAPLLPPQKVRNNKKLAIRYGQPSDIKEIMNVASEILDINIEKLEKETDNNFENLFLN